VGGNAAPLEELARSAGGTFAALAIDDTDLDRVLARSSELDPTSGATLTQSDVRTEDWKDMGAWLVWIPLVLATLAFRRGWATALLAVSFLQLATAPAQAGVLEAFQRPDQRGARTFSEGRFAESAQQFEDPAWQAAARYRAGDFAGAAESLAATPDPRSQYNLGNALAKSGKLQEAVDAYERSIAAAPRDEDAKFNRDLVKKLLEQQQPESKPSPKDGESKDGNGASADSKDGQKDGPQDGATSGTQDSNAAQPGSDDGAEPGKPAASEKPGDAAQTQGEPSSDAHGPATTAARPLTPEEQERAQWMARLPDDPGGLLREKIRRDYLRKQSARRGEDRS
jgi:Ca-activated chloride channel family protein